MTIKKILYQIIILIVFTLLVNLVYKIIYSIKEPLTNKNKQIILLGDSILNNSNYVDTKDTVLYQLQKLFNNSNNNIIMKAEDNAKLVNLDSQYSSLLEYNNSDTYIIISIGGNDILSLTNKTSQLSKLMNEYKEEITLLHSKIPKANILLVNLYYPIDTRFSIYKNFITKWNQFISGMGYPVVHLDTLLVNKNDIVSSIEPSPSGSKKIAQAILKAINK